MEHHTNVDNLNDAIIDICTTDHMLSGYAWSEAGMELYLAALEQGQLLGFKGASGAVQFDSQCYTAALNMTARYTIVVISVLRAMLRRVSH